MRDCEVLLMPVTRHRDLLGAWQITQRAAAVRPRINFFPQSRSEIILEFGDVADESSVV